MNIQHQEERFSHFIPITDGEVSKFTSMESSDNALSQYVCNPHWNARAKVAKIFGIPKHFSRKVSRRAISIPFFGVAVGRGVGARKACISLLKDWCRQAGRILCRLPSLGRKKKSFSVFYILFLLCSADLLLILHQLWSFSDMCFGGTGLYIERCLVRKLN